MLRPKEAAAEIEQLENRMNAFYYAEHAALVCRDWGEIEEVHREADKLREKIVEIKQQYPSGS